MKTHLADYFTGAIMVWIVFVLVLNFVIPTSWYFKYDRLETTDVCSGEVHKVEGFYWAAFPIPAEGIDHVISEETGNRKDRFPWDKGNYKSGHSSGAWEHLADLVPGEYHLESTELKLNLLRVFPVYLNAKERPRSNVFTVYDCKS